MAVCVLCILVCAANRVCHIARRRPRTVLLFFWLQDKLNVEAFSDPKVKGVTLYLSDFSRPVADKLMNGDMFSGAEPCPHTKYIYTACNNFRVRVLSGFT